MRRKVYITQKPARYLLSDTLPYEVPIIYNNRLLARALSDCKIHLKKCSRSNEIQLLFDSPIPTDLRIILEFLGGEYLDKDRIKLPSDSIPYEFYIPKSDGQVRRLAIVNPLFQIAMMTFNECYSNTLLYNCSKSLFSIRKPIKKATWKTYGDDAFNLSNLSSDKSVRIEEVGTEFDELRSYYVYHKYSNVYKFYDSNEFLEMEKKFNFLMRLDISKCFDSIYTHSIPWAVYEKKYVKDHLKDCNMSACFCWLDKLMQDMNYNETHGIVIGPEFSRIVSELILQAVDVELEKKLGQKNYRFGVDYTIYRYVDDFFVFYNQDQTRMDIVEYLQQELLLYKLYLNKAKEMLVGKPFITSISIAKTKLLELVDEIFPEQPTFKENNIVEKDIRIPFLHSATIIKKYKVILSETQTSYSDTMNFVLSIIETRIRFFITGFTAHSKQTEYHQDNNDSDISRIGNYYVGLARILFFLYHQYPNTNTSIRVCRIILLMLESLKKWRKMCIGDNLRVAEKIVELKQYIFTEICSYIESHPIKNAAPIEGLLLIILARELSGNFKIPCQIIEKYLAMGETIAPVQLHYFTIMVVLFYIRKNRNYSVVYDYLVKEIRIQLSMMSSETEKRLLLIDILASPYLEKTFKNEIIDSFESVFPSCRRFSKKEILQAVKKINFITWEGFFLDRELDLKRSQLVY